MAILKVAYNRKKKVATLYPIGAAPPADSEVVGTTGTGITFYDAVRTLLQGIGVHQMGSVSIVFASDLQPEVKQDPIVVEEEDDEPIINPKQRKKSIF